MNLLELLRLNRILPIIRCTNNDEIYEKASAIIDGGLNIVEINITNPHVFEVIKELSDKINVVAGGIITEIQAQFALESGAKILTSPIFQKNLTKFSKDKRVPYIAGVSTANEAYDAWKSRIPVVKIYPISAIGGQHYVENLLRPMPFLNIIPQGSVKVDEIQSYINSGALAVGVGRDLFEGKSGKQISQKLHETLESLNTND